jgi:hypothetical protein
MKDFHGADEGSAASRTEISPSRRVSKATANGCSARPMWYNGG